MIECALHVGFGKTGSSALQAYLCRHPELDTPARHRYVVVDNDGRLLEGERLRARAAASPHSYVASTPGLWERRDLETIRKDLEAVSNHGTPLLSQEDWSRTGRQFLAAFALQRLGLRTQVVAYVRPQIEWVNSGWWQWWTWLEEFATPADVLAKWPRFFWWRRQLDWWARNPCVSRLTVRLYRRNTIADFLRILGAAGGVQGGEAVVNRSLAPLHLRILKSVPHLRGPHAPQFDAILQKCMPSTEPPPWALEPQVMQSIVDGCRRDNERLLQLLPPQEAEEMRQDERWWSIEPYRGRPVTTDDQLQATPDELRRTVEALLRAAADRQG